VLYEQLFVGAVAALKCFWCLVANAPKELEGKTEEDALIAYLQGLGVNRRYIIVDEVIAK
jgi:cbb3-type cytochrome oxidase cytochrome c subunit